MYHIYTEHWISHSSWTINFNISFLWLFAEFHWIKQRINDNCCCDVVYVSCVYKEECLPWDCSRTSCWIHSQLIATFISDTQVGHGSYLHLQSFSKVLNFHRYKKNINTFFQNWPEVDISIFSQYICLFYWRVLLHYFLS